MTHTILVLNGPNLNLLGTRQPEIYGHSTLADVEENCRALGAELGLEIECRQSNHEGVLVDWIQEARLSHTGIMINPGAYSHTSIAILDALNNFEGPVAEIHISDIHKREAFRHHSYVTHRADEIVIGKGVEGYSIGMRALHARLS